MNKRKSYLELKKSIHLKVNPIVNNGNFYISVSVLNDKNNYIKDPNENKALHMPKQFYFERQIKTKLYRSEIIKTMLLELDRNAKDLILWLLLEIQPNIDYIIINKEDYCKQMNVSIKTAQRAIKSLIEKNIIATSKEIDVYFINPAIFFNGNRIKHYPNNIQIYKPNKK